MSNNVIRPALWALLATTIFSPAARAQPPAVSVTTVRVWDVGGALGLGYEDKDDPQIPYLVISGNLGRYWTAHLKTDLAVALGEASYQWVGSETRPDGSLRVAWVSTGKTSLSGAATYQFFENRFAHPYVTVGLRFGRRSQGVSTYAAATGDGYLLLLSTDSGPPAAWVRPLFGVGLKSYFADGRTFVRADVRWVVAASDVVRPLIGAGVGIDF